MSIYAVSLSAEKCNAVFVPNTSPTLTASIYCRNRDTRTQRAWVRGKQVRTLLELGVNNRRKRCKPCDNKNVFTSFPRVHVFK